MNSYDKTTWVNGGPPAINAAHLNKIEDALAEVISLANDNHVDLDKKAEYVTSATVDNATENGKVYYTTVGSSKALIVPVSGESSQVQFRLDRDGKIYSRRREKQNGEFPPWGDWTDLSAAIDPAVIRQIVLQYLDEHGVDLTGAEKTSNKANSFTVSDADATHYPTTLAVKNYVAAVIGGIENAAY